MMNRISHTAVKTLGSAALVAVLMMYACSSDKKDQNGSLIVSVIDSLFKKGDGELRGYAMGSLREEFDIGDDANILSNEKDEIVEHIDLDKKDTSYIEIYYRFENDFFTDAEINIFLKNDTVLNACADSLENFFTQKYGKAISERGITSWKGKGKKGYPVEVYITDRSFEMNEPVLMVQLHCDVIEEPVLASFNRRKRK